MSFVPYTTGVCVGPLCVACPTIPDVCASPLCVVLPPTQVCVCRYTTLFTVFDGVDLQCWRTLHGGGQRGGGREHGVLQLLPAAHGGRL
jgi:hypothetical protein